VISAVSSTSGSKASATVLAEDKTSGLVLRADVILDRIRSLKVKNKTKQKHFFPSFTVAYILHE
jgi:hypothetical protein